MLQPSVRRFFGISGSCVPELDYMLPPEQTFRDISQRIEKQSCFVLPDLSRNGKSTLLSSLAARLRSEGRFAALSTSCEVGQSLEPDLEGSIDAILWVLGSEAQLQLPEDLRPPAPKGLREDRDYRAIAESANKLESLKLRNFKGEEVAELYAQHTADTARSSSQLRWSAPSS